MGKTSSAETGVEVQIPPAFAASLSAEELQAAVKATLQYEGVWGQVTLVITDDQGIQELNRRFLGKDTPTDVLAFSAQEDAGTFIPAPEAGSYLGDVIISYPRAAAQAEEAGHSVEQELGLLSVHGVLHLLGYDHADEEGKAIMWTRQDAILAGL